ncbi:hypothetical protein NFJ76_11625 [Citrobacter freundii]|uniref:tetratricopeptide repeat protein n=1 Tax=Citrobacter freundii TaxID=546 RepID=UPI00242BA178|nr:hypothetical protein [Citrobacter freundii]WFW58465.1 hypothetical protein NFJ76_11625 [Citrobacter freundii]
MSIKMLYKSIELRKNGCMEESRKILFSLVQQNILKGSALLNIAWSYDNEGLEEEALGYYLLSLKEQLSQQEHFDALFGSACTYRCLGNLVEAERIFGNPPEKPVCS